MDAIERGIAEGAEFLSTGRQQRDGVPRERRMEELSLSSSDGDGDDDIFEEQDEDAGMMTRGEFLTGMRRTIDGLSTYAREELERGPAGYCSSEEEGNGITGDCRISLGDGILVGCVEGAKGLRLRSDGRYGDDKVQVPPSVAVKVSFVEPGEGSVLLRSRLPIHETQVSQASDSPTFSSGSFEYDVYCPTKEDERGIPRADWDSLCGDILFAVYDCGRKSREFLGQVIVPLRVLVDGVGESVSGGTQSRRERWYQITQRDGSRASGELRIALRLELPPNEPCSPKPKLAPRGPLLRRTDRRGGKKKRFTEQREDYIARQRRKAKNRIAKENELLKQRLGNVRTCTSTLKGKRNERTRMKLRRRQEEKAAEESSDDESDNDIAEFGVGKDFNVKHHQEKLTHELTKARGWLVSLEADISRLSAKISRDEKTIRRNEKLLKDMVLSERLNSGNKRFSKGRSERKKNRGPRTEATSAQRSKLRKLIDYHATLVEERGTIEAEIRRQNSKQTTYLRKKERAEAALKSASNMREWRVSGKGSAEEDAEKIRLMEEIQSVKMQLAAANSAINTDPGKWNMHIEDAEHEVKMLKEKLGRKEKKQRALRAELDGLHISDVMEREHEAMVDRIRQRVRRLRMQVRLLHKR